MAFPKMHWLQVGFFVLIFLQDLETLVIKQDSAVDTELYVAPSTYKLKDGKALPSTIIISRPFGIKEESSKDSAENDPSQGSIKIIPSRDKVTNAGDMDLKHNIKFYTLECEGGRSCSAIIPARQNHPPNPPQIPFTQTELKQYLAQFGLYDGFPYNDDYENSGTPVRPNGDESDRAFGSSQYDGSNYWPGSSYRPGYQPSKTQVVKLQPNKNVNSRPFVDFPTKMPMPNFSTRRPMLDFPNRRPESDWTRITQSHPTRKPDNKWEKIPAIRPIQNDRFSNPLSHGVNSDAILPPYGPPRPSPPPRPTTSRPAAFDGIWNRYGVSTVSQLDRDTGEWVKVSSSSTKLDQGIFDYPDTSSSGTLSPATYHAQASLTVLGISDREPHSSFSNVHANKPHKVKIPSAYPGKPPETIETDGSYVQNIASVHLPISYPLRPAAPNLLSDNPSGYAQVSVPLSILASQAILDTVSNDSSGTPSNTSKPTTTSTTTTKATTTTRPPVVTRLITTTTTTTTKPPPPAQPSEGGGSFLDNPYAVMAAVGAGLVPATFAALLPVFIGGRKRRRRRSASNTNVNPSVKFPRISENLLAEIGRRALQ
ncbi:hypothetical protein SK128_016200 [Halocaridina rubra]|uniref:Uncharacterized protein n=1 Tax=Halocaridina rubra TaxID=373956 RepID=A0AAN9ADF5_HALRR